MKTILITGGLGYLGGRIADYMLCSGMSYHIIISTRNPSKKLPKALSNVSLRTLEMSSDIKQFKEVCRGVDCIIHLAALNEIQCAQDAEAAHRINVVGTERLLEAAYQQGVSRIIYFSTVRVYGTLLLGNVREETSTKPTHPYEITHLEAESRVLKYHEQGKIESIVLRLSNSFGAPLLPYVDRWTLLLNQLARDIVVNKRCVLRSSGEQQRDFICLSDVCRLTEHLLNTATFPYDRWLFNGVSGISTPVYDMAIQLVHAAHRILGVQISVETGKEKEMAPFSYQFSTQKLSEINFSAMNDYQKELDTLMQFCLKHFNKNYTCSA